MALLEPSSDAAEGSMISELVMQLVAGCVVCSVVGAEAAWRKDPQTKAPAQNDPEFGVCEAKCRVLRRNTEEVAVAFSPAASQTCFIPVFSVCVEKGVVERVVYQEHEFGLHVGFGGWA